MKKPWLVCSRTFNLEPKSAAPNYVPNCPRPIWLLLGILLTPGRLPRVSQCDQFILSPARGQFPAAGPFCSIIPRAGVLLPFCMISSVYSQVSQFCNPSANFQVLHVPHNKMAVTCDDDHAFGAMPMVELFEHGRRCSVPFMKCAYPFHSIFHGHPSPLDPRPISVSLSNMPALLHISAEAI